MKDFDFSEANRAVLKTKIEDCLRERLVFLDIPLGSKKAIQMEADFISGAMIAIDALLPNSDPNKISAVIPPLWFVQPLRGKSVLEQ